MPWSRLKPTIYCTGDEHANHITTDVVTSFSISVWNLMSKNGAILQLSDKILLYYMQSVMLSTLYNVFDLKSINFSKHIFILIFHSGQCWFATKWRELHLLMQIIIELYKESSWLWSYDSWIYNYMCNPWLSSLKLWVRIPLMAKWTQYNILFVSDLRQVDLWFSLGTQVSSINKTDHHDITQILRKVALNTVNPQYLTNISCIINILLN
jgi:hypothetical protein